MPARFENVFLLRAGFLRSYLKASDRELIHAILFLFSGVNLLAGRSLLTQRLFHTLDSWILMGAFALFFPKCLNTL